MRLRPIAFHVHRAFQVIPLIIVALAWSFLHMTSAWGGTICGTVRDATTSAPIAHAGIFLRHPAGEYTGIHGATEPNGSFCILWVPPATYDLEVQVDDYVVAYVRNVVVTGAVTDVPLEVTIPLLELDRPAPNPARSRVRFSWKMPAAGTARVAVFDVHGKLVSAWAGTDLVAGPQSIDWDLRDRSAVRIPAGVYFLRLDAGGHRLVRRFVCVP